MKKIKIILLFGILTLLGIGSSFASYNANQSIIHLRGTSPSDISIGSYFGHSYGSRYYYYAPGVVAGSSLQYFDNCPVYESGGGLNMVYYSGGGFDINYYCGGNGTTGKFYTIPPFSVSFAGTEIVGQMFINYYNLNDIYPLVFDYSYNYFTFSNDYQLTYNGVSYYNINSTGQFGYCFYGYSDSISCVYRLSSTDFEFHYFQNLFGNITEEKGYILTPLYGTNKTFVFSYDSQNRLIYNIFSGVSDFVSDFENYELIDKGYIDTQALNFLYRALIGTDHYGSFARLSLTDSGLILSSNILIYPGTSNNGVINKAFGSSSPISLQSNSSVPNILGGNGGNGNESFPDSIFDGGIFDANTYFIEEAIKCYITSGTVCSQGFTYEASENYVNNYEHGERNRNEVDGTGDLTFNNSVDMLSQYCLNTNTIQYSFCSQLYLYEGYPITYYYNNGYFNYYIFGSGFTVNLGAMWSGQLGYAYCEGPFCSNFNEGLPQFIRKDTGDYSNFGFSGEYVSLDFFKDYFENGFFFQCPFSYSGSYFTIGGKLIDRLDSHDPLKPINCMIAGFSHGIKSSFFGDSKLGLSHSGVFLKNTGPFATRFYTFIDIVLSLGYIFLFSKLFKFLKKH